MNNYSVVDLVRISTVYTRNLSVSNHFFDTLRDDYDEFDEWYKRTASEGRQAWTITSNGNIDALCIFKEEYQGEMINDVGETLPDRFLKLCTLKVADLGLKYGQRLLYSAFCYCIKNKLSSVYLQVRKGKHLHLTELLEDYGFEIRGAYKNDLCYVKDMTAGVVFPSSRAPNLVFDYFRLHYPYHLDGSNIRKFIVSLSHGEHDILFPDARNQLLAIPMPNKSIIGDSNAIKKVIARHTYFTYVRKGDLLFFSRKSRRRKYGATIECVGVVENRKQYRKMSDIPDGIRSMIPVDLDVINRMIEKSGYVMIVAFRLIPLISHNLKLKEDVISSLRGEINILSDSLYRKYFKGRVDAFGVTNDDREDMGDDHVQVRKSRPIFGKRLYMRIKECLLQILRSNELP